MDQDEIVRDLAASLGPPYILSLVRRGQRGVIP